MKLVTIRAGRDLHPGVVVGAEVLDLVLASDHIPGARLVPPSLLELFRAESEGLDLVRRIADAAQGDAAARLLRETGALKPREAVALASPIPRPGLVLSCGTNYGAHLREFGGEIPTRPGVFIKHGGSVIGTGEPILLPPSNPEWVDFEAEFCVVFGRPCHQVSEAEALDYVAGYTLTNDVSARDWAFDIRKATTPVEANQAVLSNTLGKQFPTFSPLGPTIVTRDELADPNSVKFQSVLDGQVMQDACTDDWLFPLPWMIAEFSKFFRFEPGDVMTTGSPPGVGVARKPPVLLKDGSTIVIRNELIGELINPVRFATSAD